MKLLIVDNNKTVQHLYKMEMEEEGYEIILSSTGEEALVKLEIENPDMIIMEFLLPDIDGILLARKIKTKRPGLPLLLYTAFYHQELFSSLLWDECILKSSDIQDLKRAIIKHMIKASIGGEKLL
jgi:DNA-binding response OmpR family regulator